MEHVPISHQICMSEFVRRLGNCHLLCVWRYCFPYNIFPLWILTPLGTDFLISLSILIPWYFLKWCSWKSKAGKKEQISKDTSKHLAPRHWLPFPWLPYWNLMEAKGVKVALELIITRSRSWTCITQSWDPLVLLSLISVILELKLLQCLEIIDY